MERMEVPQQHDPEYWYRALVLLKEQSATLFRQRRDIETELRLLVRVKTRSKGRNGIVEERLEIVRAELLENGRQSEKIHRVLPEAGRRLLAAQAARKATGLIRFKMGGLGS